MQIRLAASRLDRPVEDTNAVKATARMRGDLSQGSVIMTFAKIFGYNTVDPSATAVAAVGYLYTLPKGSPGGFIAADYDFMKKAEANWNAGNKNQLYYIVLGPAGGQTLINFPITAVGPYRRALIMLTGR